MARGPAFTITITHTCCINLLLFHVQVDTGENDERMIWRHGLLSKERMDHSTLAKNGTDTKQKLELPNIML